MIRHQNALFLVWLRTPRFPHSLICIRHASTHRREPSLPRYLQRQSLPPSKITTTSTFRSKHFDPSTQTPKTELRLLEPHVLSARLKKLCDNGKIDDAVDMLKSAPLDAQNTQVWNTLIWECLKVRRFQLGYQLFVDMKRRGFSPTTRTFRTFFSGLSKIDDWVQYPKQLTNARSLYEAYQRHIESIKKTDPNDPELSIDPVGGYLRILGSSGHYQDLFHVFNTMDQAGPLAPNAFIYTSMFQAMNAARMDSSARGEKIASDARWLWTRMLKDSKKSPGFTIDSHIATSAILALAGGTTTDFELAFQILGQYYGLVIAQQPSSISILPLQAESFAAALKLCNQSKNYTLCARFLQQVQRRPDNASIIDRGHMDEILRANLALREPGLGRHALDQLEWMLRRELTGTNGPKIRPAYSTYNLVLQSCWRDADWRSAVRTFELMTGYHGHDFADGAVSESPRLDKRGPGRSFSPTAEVVSTLVQTALATRSRPDIRQVLRIVDHMGLGKFYAGSGPELSRGARNNAFFSQKLSGVLVEAVDFLLGDSSKPMKPEEVTKWKKLRDLAKEQLSVHGTTSTSDRAQRKRF